MLRAIKKKKANGRLAVILFLALFDQFIGEEERETTFQDQTGERGNWSRLPARTRYFSLKPQV